MEAFTHDGTATVDGVGTIDGVPCSLGFVPIFCHGKNAVHRAGAVAVSGKRKRDWVPLVVSGPIQTKFSI